MVGRPQLAMSEVEWVRAGGSPFARLHYDSARRGTARPVVAGVACL